MSNDIYREDAERIAAALGDSLGALENRTILVTGAAGFLCGYLFEVLAQINEARLGGSLRMIGLDNYLRGVPDRLAHLVRRFPGAVRVEDFDVTRPYRADEAIDFIVHGASIASPTYYRLHPLETIDVNVNGLRHMLDLARQGARSMISLSSSEIYGDPDPSNIPTAEDYRGNVSCTGPRACYDESKRLGETLAVEYHRQFAVPVKIIRPFNVYGPGQRLDDKRVVPDLLSSVIARRPIVLFSDGRATRSFCYASDFIAGMLLVMIEGADGEAYNVGNDEEVSILEAAQTAASLVSPPLEVRYQISDDKEYLTDNPQRRCPDLSRIRSLGYVPRVGLREGLARCVSSYETEAGDLAPAG